MKASNAQARRVRTPTLSPDHRDALRKVLRALHNQGHQALWREADVELSEYSNFVNERRRDLSPQARIRVINHLVKNEGEFARALEIRRARGEFEALKKLWLSHASWIDDDHIFRHLESIGAVTKESCEEICRDIAGIYDLYRLSAEPAGHLHRSHLEIFPFSIYSKVPRFVNQMVIGPGRLRIIDGNIIFIGHSYCFFGYVRIKSADQSAIIGTKVMILTRLPRPKRTTLMGPFYTSGSEEVYNVGATRAISTTRKFDEHDEDVLDVQLGTSRKEVEENAKRLNLPFRISDLALRYPPNALIENFIYSTLKFNVKIPEP